jgi:hypothetical protein
LIYFQSEEGGFNNRFSKLMVQICDLQSYRNKLQILNQRILRFKVESLSKKDMIEFRKFAENIGSEIFKKTAMKTFDILF